MDGYLLVEVGKTSCYIYGNYLKVVREMILPDKIRTAIGNRTYKIDDIGMSDSQIMIFDDMVLKIQQESGEAKNERVIMSWLDGKLPVPQVICHEIRDGRSYLLMTRVAGKMSCDMDYINDPYCLVNLLVDGLKKLWSIGTCDCPCDNRLEYRLRSAEFIVQNNLVDLDNVEPETFGENGFKNPAELLNWLKENRPVEDLVLSHGDYCLPNIFAEGKSITGFIDLGRAGIADRYQDIAICYRSLKHNLAGLYGGHAPVAFDANILFERLGIDPDWDKIRYFMLLDELY